MHDIGDSFFFNLYLEQWTYFEPLEKTLNFRASWRRTPVLEHGARRTPQQEIILCFGSVRILGWRGEWPYPPNRRTSSTLCCPLKFSQSMILSNLMTAALDCCEQSSDKSWIREKKRKKEEEKILVPSRSSSDSSCHCNPAWTIQCLTSQGEGRPCSEWSPFLGQQQGKLGENYSAHSPWAGNNGGYGEFGPKEGWINGAMKGRTGIRPSIY